MSERKRPNSRRNLDITIEHFTVMITARHATSEKPACRPCEATADPRTPRPQRKRLCTRHAGPAVTTPKYFHAPPPRKTPHRVTLSTKTRPQPGRREGRENVP